MKPFYFLSSLLAPLFFTLPLQGQFPFKLDSLRQEYLLTRADTQKTTLAAHFPPNFVLLGGAP